MTNPINEKDVIEANRIYYDQVANDYLRNESYAYTDEIVRDVRHLLEFSAQNCGSQKVFLDLGCGSGFLSKLVNDSRLFESGFGIDVSQTQIDLYSKNLSGSSFSAFMGDAANLDFPDSSVDMIGGYSVLHHFFDYERVLKEACRVVKPGGCIYFDFEPNADFKKSMKLLIDFRRWILDPSPTSGKGLEEVAEFHNNYALGIDPDQLLSKFEADLRVLKKGYRFPGTFAGKVLRQFSRLSSSLSPLFYFVAQKK
jgi:ubiquinone/menaquinone biosynthesis C-methylase UbiE